MLIKNVIDAQVQPGQPGNKKVLQVFLKITDSSVLDHPEITTPVPEGTENVSVKNILQMVLIDESHELFERIKNKFNITFNE